MTHPNAVKRDVRDAWARLADIDSKIPELMAALSDAQPGFPSGRSGSGGERATMPERLAIRHVDSGIDEVTKIPYFASPDDALSDRALFERTAQQTLRSVALLEQIANRWTTSTHKKPEDQPELWCSNHLQFKLFEPRGSKHGTRCGWCANFKTANGFEAPREILEYRHQHGRVTMAMIEQHRPKQTVRKGKSKKGKKAA